MLSRWHGSDASNGVRLFGSEHNLPGQARRPESVAASNAALSTSSSAAATVSSGVLQKSWRGSSTVSSGLQDLRQDEEEVLSIPSQIPSQIPSLDRSFTTVSSEPSCTNTDQKSEIYRILQSVISDDRLERSGNTARTRPTVVIYQCVFKFLGCIDGFHDEEDWKTHSQSHFRTHAPPQFAQCSMCDWKVSGCSEAWALRMVHVADHYSNGQRLEAPYRPDAELYKHLFNKRLVTGVQYQELIQNNDCDLTLQPEGTTVHDERRDRRRGGAQRTSSTRL